jgi:hypothetical protein
LKISVSVGDDVYASQIFAVDSLKKYRLSLRYFSNTGNTRYKLIDSKNNLSYDKTTRSWKSGDGFITVQGNTNTWNLETFDFFVNSETTDLNLLLYYDDQSVTTVYYDDIYLNPIFFSNIDGNNYNVILESPNSSSDNSSYYFDGSSYLEINTNDSIKLLNNNFTTSIWFKRKGSAKGSDQNTFHTLLSGINGNLNTKFSLSSSGDYLNFKCNTTSGIQDVNSDTFTFEYGSWHNFLVSKSENIVSFYLDGELLNTETFNYSCLNGTDNLYIGSSENNILENVAYGYISDPRIYNKFLNQEEIINNYNSSNFKYTNSTQIPYYSDLILYLDANSMNDIYNNGDKVYLWQDLSNSDNNAIQENSTYQPVFVENSIGNLPAIKFSDNIHYYLQTINNSNLSGNEFDLTVIAVFKLNVTTKNYSSFISQYQDSGYNCFGLGVFASAGTKLAVDQWHPSGRKGSTVIQLDTPYLASVVIPQWSNANTTSKFYLNGIRENDATFSSWSTPNLVAAPFNIGNWKYSRSDMGFTGELSELLVFSRDLEDYERNDVESYLKSKYNLN